MHAFPKSARLRHSQEFRHTLEHGLKAVCPKVVIFARPRAATAEDRANVRPNVRLGLVVSKKVGESVARSRVKRHLREAFRHLKPELDQSNTFKDVDLVAIARNGAADASSAEIADALHYCLQRLSRQLRQS